MTGSFLNGCVDSPVVCKLQATISQCVLLIALILFIHGCQNKNDSLDTAINETQETCISIISSDPDNKWNTNNAEYGLGEEWQYEHDWEKIQVLYNKSFFFLIQKDVAFSNTSDRKIKKHIRTIYSCSGATPHLTTLKRTYCSEDVYGKLKVDKIEVLEGGKLVVSPTKEDVFFDVLRRQESRKEKRK